MATLRVSHLSSEYNRSGGSAKEVVIYLKNWGRIQAHKSLLQAVNTRCIHSKLLLEWAQAMPFQARTKKI